MILDSAKLINYSTKVAFRSIAGAWHKTAIVKFYQRPLARNCGYTQIVMRNTEPHGFSNQPCTHDSTF